MQDFDMKVRDSNLSAYINGCLKDTSFLITSNKKSAINSKIENAILESTLSDVRPYFNKFVTLFMKPYKFEVIGKRVLNYMVKLLNKGRKITSVKVIKLSYLLLNKFIIKIINLIMKKYILVYTKKNTRNFLVKFESELKPKSVKWSRRRLKVYRKLMRKLYLKKAVTIRIKFIKRNDSWLTHSIWQINLNLFEVIIKNMINLISEFRFCCKHYKI